MDVTLASGLTYYSPFCLAITRYFQGYPFQFRCWGILLVHLNILKIIDCCRGWNIWPSIVIVEKMLKRQWKQNASTSMGWDRFDRRPGHIFVAMAWECHNGDSGTPGFSKTISFGWFLPCTRTMAVVQKGDFLRLEIRWKLPVWVLLFWWWIVAEYFIPLCYFMLHSLQVVLGCGFFTGA